MSVNISSGPPEMPSVALVGEGLKTSLVFGKK